MGDSAESTKPSTSDPTSPALSTAAPPATTAPPATAAPPAGECKDPNNKYGVVASTNGFGGCPPKVRL